MAHEIGSPLALMLTRITDVAHHLLCTLRRRRASHRPTFGHLSHGASPAGRRRRPAATARSRWWGGPRRRATRRDRPSHRTARIGRFCLMDECAITFGRRTSTRTSVSYHIANTANSPRGALRYSVCCLRVMTFHERGGKVVCRDPPATRVPAWTCGRTRFGSSRVLEALMSSSVSTRCWAT